MTSTALWHLGHGFSHVQPRGGAFSYSTIPSFLLQNKYPGVPNFISLSTTIYFILKQYLLVNCFCILLDYHKLTWPGLASWYRPCRQELVCKSHSSLRDDEITFCLVSLTCDHWKRSHKMSALCHGINQRTPGTPRARFGYEWPHEALEILS